MHRRLAGRVAASVLLALSMAACRSAEPSGSAGPTPPAPPVALALAADGITPWAATLHGTVDPAGSDAVGWLEWGGDAALASAIATPPVRLGGGASALPISAPVGGLAPGTTYWFRAAGANSGGIARAEIRSFTTAFLPPDPLTLAADAVAASGATLHASVNPAGSAAEGWFEWGTDPALEAPSTTAHAALGGGTAPVPASAALDGLRPGTTYWFRVAGANAGGTARGEIRSFTTPFPAPGVATLAADPVGDGSGTLRGSVVPAGSSAQGWFEWGTDAALASPAQTARVALGSGAAAVATSADLAGLAAGATFWYRAVAANAGGTARGEVRSFVAGHAPPSVATRAPDSLAADGATMHADVDPSGLATEAWFEWSADPSLAAPTETGPVSLAAGSGAVPIAQPLSGVAPGTTVYYRAVASSAAGTTRGAVEWFGIDPADPNSLLVNSADDVEDPPPGKLTLRAAMARIPPGGTITFAPGLDGATIALTRVGEAHSTLQGEVYTFDPVARAWVYEGFQDRDFGPSGLYAGKSLALDASALRDGIVLAWAGGDASPARVLAVYGDLTLRNVSIVSGNAVAAPLAGDAAQPWTLARGGGLAVWGTATLVNCVVAGNRVSGDTAPSRDRGAFGGGIYADLLVLEDSIVSGNSATGFGAAGGGIYSVGGLGSAAGATTSRLARSSVTGNRVTGQHAYGGGVFSDGAGMTYGTLEVESCTIARNVVEDHPGIAESAMAQYYARGGGIYASNGVVSLAGSTVVENAVSGHAATFSGRPNLGGGGIAATIGDAHVVESMDLRQSIVAGNTLNGAAEDVFTGSLVEFYSTGRNLVGRLDFSRILVPIPEWQYLSRRHWPKAGDRDGVALAEAVAAGAPRRSAWIVSAGTDAGERAVLWYAPGAAAVGRVPAEPYPVSWVRMGYMGYGDATDDFLNHLLAEVRRRYGVLGDDFGARFGDLTGTTWYLSAGTWPSDPANAPWIAFWRELDVELAGRLGAVGLGDDFWAAFPQGPLDQLEVYGGSGATAVPRVETDQLGNARPSGAASAIGAVEAGAPSGFWTRAESGGGS